MTTYSIPQVDERVLSEMLSHARPTAYSFSHSTGIDADDLLQDVAVHLARKWNLIMAANDPYTYAQRVARNTMINAYQKETRRHRIAPSYSLNALAERGVQF